ncbi:MAG TPA: ATP-binding cassette domain-containing protein [Opitutales bacterium]|jgi:molybdate transport system ATP-binding protein|nr:ATP-binding cassette domain-containing protein [Opitutales bacterium]
MSGKIARQLVELCQINLTLDRRPVLREVNWTVQRGEGWLVTGANGAGKTSLLRILSGQTWPDSGKRGGERIYHFDKKPSASPIGLEGRIAWLSPEAHQRFVRLETPALVSDVILTGFANTLLLTHRPTAAQRAAARIMAHKLGLTKIWPRPFAELSQGQQRLVLLARALVAKPRLLVLDEFSDGLDHAARARVGAAIIQRLRAGAAVVVATHRTSDVLPGLSRHLQINLGLANEVLMPAKEKVGTSLRDVRSKAKRSAVESQSSPLVLEFRDASVYVGDHLRTTRILHNITWKVHAGEHWAVLGANGSGKSTLLRTIYGDWPVARGGVLRRFGKDERLLPLPEARRRMGYVSPALQHHYAADASVVEVVASGFQSTYGLLRKPTQTEFKKAIDEMRKLRASHLANRRWGELSFGEARLALLARALAPRPKLLLLDEPCDGLSPTARQRFLRAIAGATRQGTQVIIAAHRAEDLPSWVNRVLRLQDGRII